MASTFGKQFDAMPRQRVRDLAPHFLANVTVALLLGDVENAPDLEPVDGPLDGRLAAAASRGQTALAFVFDQ